MAQAKLTILGAGSLRCSPAVIGSLGSFFGERPLDVHFWDADMERLDLFDRFARGCFSATKSSHRLMATTDVAEALEGTTGIIFQVGGNCARKYVGQGATVEESVHECLTDLAPRCPDDVPVLNLMPSFRRLPLAHAEAIAWPSRLNEEERAVLLFHVLRCVNAEEGFFPFLRDNQESPVKKWLRSTMTR